MSHEKNFVSELVQMARAFEELPGVKAELEAANGHIEDYARQVQRLEMRLIDAKAEIDAAHAATTKAEVERDHAETMFLETDQKLDTLRGIFSHFQAEVAGFVRATEPEPVAPPSLGGAEQIGLDAAYGYPLADEPVAPVVPGGQDIPSWAGPKAQPSPVTPETNTDTASSITSPEGAGLSGLMGESLPPLDAEVRDLVDPIPQQSLSTSVSPDGSMATDVQTVDASPQQDDVGYHNEPSKFTQSWYDWGRRMDNRFGVGNWPFRPATA